MVCHSPDPWVDALVDLDERGESARSILATLHAAAEGTPANETVHFREHMEKRMWVLFHLGKAWQ
jgi:hypothetical protein